MIMVIFLMTRYLIFKNVYVMICHNLIVLSETNFQTSCFQEKRDLKPESIPL